MRVLCFAMITCLALGLSGCVSSISMPYVMKTDRTDQQMGVGNRGYLKGTAPAPKEHDPKRPLIAIDVDLEDSVAGTK